MNPSLRAILIAIGVLTLIAVGVIVIPRGLSLYYQTRGGQHVDFVLRHTEGIEELVCKSLPAGDTTAQQEVEQGIANLTRATRIYKNNSQAFYQLGKAYCLVGKPEEAIENFQKYTELRPENPLGYIGLGFAYEESKDMSLAEKAWRSAKINPEDFTNLGDEEFRAQQYSNAIKWYERSELLGGKQSAYSKFNWSAASILSDNPFPTQLDPNTIPVYQLEGVLNIEGDKLQWFRPEDKFWNIRYGQPLSDHPTGDPGVGGMWWDGAVVAIVNFPCKANYDVQVRAIHTNASDKIGQLHIEHNLSPVAKFIMTEDWQDYETGLQLNAGYHLIGIDVEDIGDVFVDWLIINRVSDCIPDS